MDMETRLVAIACMNILAFAVFVWDKAMANGGRQRIPESSLLLLTMAGGEIGSIGAMLVVRHKTRKRAFLWKFWLCFLVGIAVNVFFLQA